MVVSPMFLLLVYFPNASFVQFYSALISYLVGLINAVSVCELPNFQFHSTDISIDFLLLKPRRHANN